MLIVRSGRINYRYFLLCLFIIFSITENLHNEQETVKYTVSKNQKQLIYLNPKYRWWFSDSALFSHLGLPISVESIHKDAVLNKTIWLEWTFKGVLENLGMPPHRFEKNSVVKSQDWVE